MMRTVLLAAALASVSAALLAGVAAPAAAAGLTLLNASCSPTTELYEQINPMFEAYWKAKTASR